MSGDYFGPLRCYSCGNPIKNVAYSESGDEDHIYCTKCWAVKGEEKAKAECMKMADADAEAGCLKALKKPIYIPEYYIPL